jgi:phosphopantetheine adenylyltransferase
MGTKPYSQVRQEKGVKHAKIYAIDLRTTNLSHQANSSTWQQTLAIHPNSNRGTETQVLDCR